MLHDKPSDDKTDSPRDESDPDSLIDANLRRVYDDLVEDEVPERFRSLLEQLRRQEGDK
ncbi:NepR family anti-sigma factor [Rhodosalinus halophilus]|uniref:NepR family anti-sigma factor n=1 Tax=Rhodosalinus halophilus TaxID=2259333 RepID=UPI001F400D8B|nr:NepR family anti-sigma factor [Rhodosalinus halophilus]